MLWNIFLRSGEASSRNRFREEGGEGRRSWVILPLLAVIIASEVAMFASEVATFGSEAATFASEVATFGSEVATFGSEVATMLLSWRKVLFLFRMMS